jgi:type II secretory ATPase GspE/PulE/Tfp pilus assembly ATPase PilB-like protein
VGLADLLLERGLSRADLSNAERLARSESVPLVEAIVTLGLASEETAYGALAAAAGGELVDLSTMPSSELAIRLVPERLARQLLAVPLAVDNRTLTYATCRPFNPDAERDLGFAAGRRTVSKVATRSAVLERLDVCYPRLRELRVLADRVRSDRPTVEAVDALDTTGVSESGVVEFCNRILARAVDIDASEVQIDCSAEGTTVRYRVCGIIEPSLTLPAAISLPIRNRFKTMARVGVAVRSRPQEGTFRLKVNARHIDVRLSSLPTVGGEKLEMRVVDGNSAPPQLDRLGFDADSLGRLRSALTRPDGLVLVAGPGGCGKTTTLYALLAHLRAGRTTVISVEDPVERTLPGLTQVPVNTKAGNTMASTMRSMLRQKPDVIMVGEIRDREVAQVVEQAACTGHLVISSLQTADAASAIMQLASLGFEPARIAECLSVVVGQQLLRSLCPHCRRTYDEHQAQRLGTERGIARVPAAPGSGCPHCKHTGYVGRLPVVEVLAAGDQLRGALARGATLDDIRTAQRAARQPSMRDRALQLVADGITSIDEVDRVLGGSSPAASTTVPARPRVLIADDEPITRMLVKLLLEREPYDVLEAANGRQAVEIAMRQRPDLLMIDLNMPEMDGYEAIARLRRDFTLATLPIIVLTAEDGPGVERRVLELGADDYMLKPFDPAVLLSRVNAVFRRLKVMAA